jgi:hypothetical protein
MGARPCMTYNWFAGAGKANPRARSVLLPRGRCTASSLPRPMVQPQHGGQVCMSGTWRAGSCARRTRTTTGEARHRLRRRASSPPPKATAQGPGPTSHPPRVIVPGCREVKLPLALMPRLLGTAVEDGEVKFSKLMQQNQGTLRVTQRNSQIRKSQVDSGRARAAWQLPIKLWPHLQARSLP